MNPVARTNGWRGALVWMSACVVLIPLMVHADPPRPTFLPPSASARGSNPKKDSHTAPSLPRLRVPLLTMLNVHTREALVLPSTPTASEPALVARFARDRVNWEEHTIAPGCLETLRRAATFFGAIRGEMVSGFRSDKLNENLRKKGRHVARQSQHVEGAAMDFRLLGVETPALLRFVRRTHRGGTGFYPQSGFVHVDMGRVRQWSGQ